MPVQKRSCLKLKRFTWPRLGRLCWRGKWGFRTGSIVMASRSNPLGRLHLHMPMRRLLWPPRSKVFSPMALLYSVGIEYVCVDELSHGAFPHHNGSILQPRFVWNDRVWCLMAKRSTFLALAGQRSSGGWKIGHRCRTTRHILCLFGLPRNIFSTTDIDSWFQVFCFVFAYSFSACVVFFHFTAQRHPCWVNWCLLRQP